MFQVWPLQFQPRLISTALSVIYLMKAVIPVNVKFVELKLLKFFTFSISTLIKYFFESRNMASLIDGEVEQDVDNPFVSGCIVSSNGVRIRKGGKEL